MDYTAFSHGQILSKKWLCDTLEPHIKDNSTIWILGSWYNLIAFMLLVRGNKTYKSIVGYDINTDAVALADSICNAWTWDNPVVSNQQADVNQLDWSQPPDVVINCSGEHFADTAWWNHIPLATLVAIQSSNVVNNDPQWDIKQPNENIDVFLNRYPVSTQYFTGTKYITTGQDTGYERYMLIGRK